MVPRGLAEFERQGLRSGLCVPVAIHNASVAVGLPLDTATLIHRMESAKVLIPGEGEVQDIHGAVAAIQKYARGRGVVVYNQDIVPRPEFRTWGLPVAPTLPVPRALVATLSDSYITKYHDVLDEVPVELKGAGFVGPSHCVTLLAMDDREITFFDPDPAFKKEFGLAGFPAGTIRLRNDQFDVHYSDGDAAKEIIVVERFQRRTARKARPSVKGQKTFADLGITLEEKG